MPSHRDKTGRVGAFEAKTHLSELLERVRRGERITITKRGVPMAVLVPPEQDAQRRIREAIGALDELRSRTRPGPDSILDLRDAGRRR